MGTSSSVDAFRVEPQGLSTLDQRARFLEVGTLPPDARLIVTIDGPAGTGKSSTARQLARRLGLAFLDTGAMYRAAALLAIDAKVPLADHAEIVRLASEARIHFDWTRDPPAVIAAGSDVTSRIRSAEVTAVVSPISAIPALRALLVKEQRRIGREHPRLVTEGRDQGSVVFPDADVKFYLDAAPDVRASRRADEIEGARGAPLSPAERELILRDIIDRDQRDSSRADGPLTRPADAIFVDTSALGLPQVVDRLEREARARITTFG